MSARTHQVAQSACQRNPFAHNYLRLNLVPFGRVEEWRGGVGEALRVCRPFRLPVPEYPTMPRFHSPLIEPGVRICRTRLSDRLLQPAHGPVLESSPACIAASATAEPYCGVASPCGQSPGSWSLPQRTRSEAPSLRRHYPASTVLWASPTPHAARPVPRGRPVGSRSHRLGSPVLRAFSLCRHAIATTPAGSSQGSSCSLDFDDGGLPQMSAGSAPAVKSFRGLLGVHACYGLPARGVANATLSIEGFGSIVTSTTAPIATGWSNSCQVGIAPTEERRLCTAHGHPELF